MAVFLETIVIISDDRILHTSRQISCFNSHVITSVKSKKSKAVPLHEMEAPGGEEYISPTHSRPRH
jgi:hypothetical protein